MHPDVAIYHQLRRGQIQVEPGWQIIAIPSRFGEWNAGTNQIDWTSTAAKVKEYVVDQLEDVYGAGVVEVCNARVGDTGYSWNFIPASTPAGSEHNFQLMVEDVGISEYEQVAFWIKSTHGSPMLLNYVEHRIPQ